MKKFKIVLLILFLVSIYLKGLIVLAKNQEVILNWSVNNYAPFWYQGLKLPTRGSEMKVGLTHLKQDDTDYYYQWFVNDKRLNDWEKNKKETSFIIKDLDNSIEVRIGKKEIIKSKLFLPDKEVINLVSREFLNFETFDPELLIYLNNGQRLNYFDDLTIRPGTKREFLAVPYFFNITNPNELKFVWRFLSNVFSGEDAEPDKFILDLKEGSGKSVSLLSVIVKNEESLQNISAKVKIKVK